MGRKVEPPVVPAGTKTRTNGSIGNPKRGIWCPSSNLNVPRTHVLDPPPRVDCPVCGKNLKGLVVDQKKETELKVRYPYHYQSRRKKSP